MYAFNWPLGSVKVNEVWFSESLSVSVNDIVEIVLPLLAPFVFKFADVLLKLGTGALLITTAIFWFTYCLVVSNPCSDAVNSTAIVLPLEYAEPLRLLANLKVVLEPVVADNPIKLPVDLTSHRWDAPDDHCPLVPVLPFELIFISLPLVADSMIYKLSQLSDIALAASSAMLILIKPVSDVVLNASFTVTW